MQYTEKNLVVKMKIFIEKGLIFFYFCSKHRLWVHVRTASARGGSNEYPQSMFSITDKKIGIPLQTSVLQNKSVVGGGIHVKDMFS